MPPRQGLCQSRSLQLTLAPSSVRSPPPAMPSRHAHDPDTALLEDDDLDLELEADPRNPHVSGTRWRHEESSAFRKHAGQNLQPRAAEAKTGTHDLADFLNSMRVAPEEAAPRSSPGSTAPNRYTPIMVDGQIADAAGEPNLENDPAQAEPQDGKTIACGPLLNYRRMDGNIWVGSVLIVTKGGGKTWGFTPTLLLRRVGEAQHIHAPGTNGNANGAAGATEIQAQCLYSDLRNTFWRFDLRCEMEANEIKWDYTVPDTRFASKTKPRANSFYVPAITESMRSMSAHLRSGAVFQELRG